jgi:hypothetical protein
VQSLLVSWEHGRRGNLHIVTNENGVIAFLKEDFLEGAVEAADTVDAYMHAIAAAKMRPTENVHGAVEDSQCPIAAITGL